MNLINKGVIKINREEKRKYIKTLRAKGISKEDAELYLNYKQKTESIISIPEGTKVNLDLEQIKSQPDYERHPEKYKNWVEANEDNVFTVEYDEGKKVNPVTVCLKEDESQPKWLFWIGDLKVVENV